MKITALFAFITEDRGVESVVNWNVGGENFAMIFSDPTILEQATTLAESVSRVTGRTIKLVKFTLDHELRRVSG